MYGAVQAVHGAVQAVHAVLHFARRHFALSSPAVPERGEMSLSWRANFSGLDEETSGFRAENVSVLERDISAFEKRKLTSCRRHFSV